ncbi:hypothetical protein [Brevundimonas sp. SL130]|nr:hypothetical protein [Brevundimonas sp. SL130]WAC60847.1 hypothetical protein OU998_05220 [Brevundimonas sp. SL130]
MRLVHARYEAEPATGTIPGVDLGDDFRSAIRIDAPGLLVAGSLDGDAPY